MITLADLRARDALPVWQEAVAIVQALLDTTMAERRSASRLPDVTHIGLEEDGAVVLLPQGSIPEHPVRHLAAVLGVLIESMPAPPPLLDFVNRNLADPPEHATAEDFSRALKYFERPERTEDIRHVVERALGAPVHTDVEAAQRQLEARVQELVAPLADGLPLVLETKPAADDAPALAADDARVRSDAALAATDEPPADLPAMEPAAAVVRTWPSEEARREVQRAFDSELFRGLVPLTILALVIGAGYVARDRTANDGPGAVERRGRWRTPGRGRRLPRSPRVLLSRRPHLRLRRRVRQARGARARGRHAPSPSRPIPCPNGSSDRSPAPRSR